MSSKNRYVVQHIDSETGRPVGAPKVAYAANETGAMFAYIAGTVSEEQPPGNYTEMQISNRKSKVAGKFVVYGPCP